MGGRSVKIAWEPDGTISKLDVWQESLTDAGAALEFRAKLFKVGNHGERREMIDATKQAVNEPDKRAAKYAEDRAETLVADAQALDPRLVRKASWVRSVEGETCCPSLLLAGEENPFFRRQRQNVDVAANAEPVVVVVGTDSSEVTADSFAAFVATVKLVQQFRPVHVYWQGAWMVDAYQGYVFHVPLVLGDMDFERLAFVINSEFRDRASFAFMVRRAKNVTNQRWNGADKPANRSYLAGSVDFIDHAGINASAESVAERACRWLGWENLWGVAYNERETASSALCRWDAGEDAVREKSSGGSYEETAADRKRWERERRERDKERERQAREESRKRMGAV